MVPIYPDRAKLLARLHRIEGQIRGLERMVQEDKPCLDILTQLTSVKAALKAVSFLLIEREFQDCLLEQSGRSTEEQEVKALAILTQVKMFGVPSRN